MRRYRLSASQWQQIRATREFQTNPQWRLAQLDGNHSTSPSPKPEPQPEPEPEPEPEPGPGPEPEPLTQRQP